MEEHPPVRGLDVGRVTGWLRANLSDLAEPFRFELIAAGGSNLTYRVADAAGTTVALRRPPEGQALATAHDVDREWRIMSALGTSGAAAVPACLARCDDPEVTGASFYVMGFVDGLIIRSRAEADALSEGEARRATDALLGAQVDFHTLDLAEVGLTDLGRHDSYVGRQLKRWKAQVERADARPVPLVHELHARLAERIPPERARPALAHGDYRFDNVVLDEDYSMAAILDWELCTTGDPIADFAWSVQYWADPGEDLTWLPDAPTTSPTFPRRAEVIRAYETATGFDLSDYPFYEAFSWWKQACIVEGAYARRLKGSQGGMAQAGPVSAIADRVDAMLDRADALLAALD
ncbi:MAG: acyl-CoA dehydrogenase [Acidimicrobiales bacterium]|nr:MAG: acyl-CoA dehydrogenase [Acidimicrobiales bacterium]